MAREDYLFVRIDWHSVDSQQRQQMVSEIERLDPERLLNTSVEDLAQYFSDQYKVAVPAIDEDNIVVDQREKNRRES